MALELMLFMLVQCKGHRNIPQPFEFVEVDVFAGFKGPILWVLVPVLGRLYNNFCTTAENIHIVLFAVLTVL